MQGKHPWNMLPEVLKLLIDTWTLVSTPPSDAK